MIPFSEALLLGVMSQPTCKGAFLGDDGAGCLVTAAVRACGVEPKSTTEVIDAAFRLWPWLDTQAMPAVVHESLNSFCRATWAHDYEVAVEMDHEAYRSGPIVWIAEHHDATDAPVEWIAAQIALLEEYMLLAPINKRNHDEANRKEREARQAVAA
jgi:hypothetical protein